MNYYFDIVYPVPDCRGYTLKHHEEFREFSNHDAARAHYRALAEKYKTGPYLYLSHWSETESNPHV